MKRNFLVASIFFLTTGFIGNNSSSIALDKNEVNKIDLNPSYLEKLPSNDYILGSGDQINIIVSRDYPELTSNVFIDGEGTIYLPLLNRVYVSGLTLNELNLTLNKAFSKFVKFPSVEVSILRYRPIRVFVKGEVENPGFVTLQGSFSINKSPEIPFNLNRSENIFNGNIESLPNSKKSVFYFPTVFDALRASGGITSFSDLSNIQVIRKNNISNGSGQIQTTLNFEELLKTGNNSQNIRIYDSDIIKVRKTNNPDNIILRKAVVSNLNPKYINVFVTGRVNNPGNTLVSRASTLNDAIDIAGGAKAIKGPVTFLRFNNDGIIDKRRFALRKNAKRGSYKNPYLRSGDLVVVDESTMSTLNTIITEFTTPFIGIYSTYGVVKALTE